MNLVEKKAILERIKPHQFNNTRFILAQFWLFSGTSISLLVLHWLLIPIIIVPTYFWLVHGCVKWNDFKRF